MEKTFNQVVLKAENLSRSFGSFQAVKNLNLEIHEGEILGLLGPNGAGKTTTISMLCGLLPPSSGRVLYQNKSLDTTPEARRAIGVCPQSIVIWKNLTCLEQLTFMGEMVNLPEKVARQRSEMLLEKLELSEKRHKLAATLSGGMQRRLNIALALVHDPYILVLDEPEAGLDPQSRVLVREFVRQWAQQPGRTVILTTHNMDEAERLAQRVAIIDQGVLLVVDTPEALKHSLGEGDILEIDLAANGDSLTLARQALEAVTPNLRINGQTLVIHSGNVIELLPEIVHSLQQVGVRSGEVRLRANTLEDVFIHLTGRRLRE
jgi:ABC-2 type transport system ATP-binding protein